MDRGKAKNIHANRMRVGVGESTVDIAIVSGRTCRDFPVTSWCGFGFCPLLPPAWQGSRLVLPGLPVGWCPHVAHCLHRQWWGALPGLRKGNTRRCIPHMARLTVLDPSPMCVFVGMHVPNPASRPIPEGRPAIVQTALLDALSIKFSI